MSLDTIFGNLKAYNQFEPFSLLHADQLTAEQVNNPSLRTIAFYVADFSLYTVEEEQKKPTLWLARHTAEEPHNLVLRHLDDEKNSSFNQLVKTGNYNPTPEEVQEVMSANGTLRIELTQLTLKGYDKEWRYLEISTTHYDSLNAEDRLLAERFYGQGDNFIAAMKMLKDAHIDKTRVYVFSPEYVAKGASESPVGRAAWRRSFDYYAISGAVVHDIGSLYALRGVRKK